MPNIRKPRSGSLQFAPRVRARRQYPRVRKWVAGKDAKLLGFAGYKVGMTHLMFKDDNKKSFTAGLEVSWPATIIECPPLKVASYRFYKQNLQGFDPVSQITSSQLDKELKRKIVFAKKKSEKKTDDKDFDQIRLIVYTQPKLTTIGKKKPEVFEIALGGSKEDQLAYAQEKLGKEIPVSEILTEGQFYDIHAVTKGKGFQGPVKRFGISLRSHKSEKSVRNPGSLGPWVGQGNIMWRVAHAGQTGYHTRTEYNKLLLKIGDDPKDINVKGGFINYGNVKNTYILLKGSIPGPKKRLIRLTCALRSSDKKQQIPDFHTISQESQQGN